MGVEESLADRRKKYREAHPDPIPAEFDDDLIPDVGRGPRAPDELDTILDGVDILQAYERWCGKMAPKVGSKRESVMISCPIPGHADKNPSAWMNLDKGTWYCGACQQGGDKFDIAAFRLGFNVPGYKTDGNFPELRRQMGADLGYVVTRSGGQDFVQPEKEREAKPSAAPTENRENSGNASSVASKASSVGIDPAPTLKERRKKAGEPPKKPEVVADAPKAEAPSESSANEKTAPSKKAPSFGGVSAAVMHEVRIEWRDIVPPGTFLYQWMMETSQDDLPEEHYFWLGLSALGLAAGRDCYLNDYPPVFGNLYICLFGSSGSGKTRAVGNLSRLVREALPHDPLDPHSTGTKMVPTPGSAEALIDSLTNPVFDPADPKHIIEYAPIRGMLRFDEFATLAARAAWSGSSLKPILMELFDGYGPVSVHTRGSGIVTTDNYLVSTFTSTQPGAIRKLLGGADIDSGFLNRWVFTLGPAKSMASYQRGSINTQGLVGPLQNARRWCRHAIPNPTVVDLSPEAVDEWEKFFRAKIEPLRLGLNPLLARTDLLLKKAMLLFAINEEEPIITPEMVRRACTLYEYLMLSWGVLGGQIGTGGEFAECVEGILKVVKEASDSEGLSMREIGRSQRRFTPDIVARAVKSLVDIGELQEETSRRGRGPATKRYTIAA